MKTTVFQVLEQHKRLLEKRDRAIKNVEYPCPDDKMTLEFVAELQRLNNELVEFLGTEITIEKRPK